MFPFTSHCLPMSFLVNRLKVVAVEVLDAIEELKLRTGQPLARFELQAHKLKGTQRVRSLEEPIVLGMDFEPQTVRPAGQRVGVVLRLEA